MKASTIGRAIGGASLIFGIFDVLNGRRLGRAVGAGEEMGGRLFRLAGAREVTTGIAGLIRPASATPIRWRLAGDLFDLAALGYVAAPANPRRRNAWLALGIVAAVAAVDFLAARALAAPSGRQ